MSNEPEPITFTEPSYALFDVDANAVLTTQYGNLAIWSTAGMAAAWALKSKSQRNVIVVAVKITRMPGQ